jgi:hypothetical protein
MMLRGNVEGGVDTPTSEDAEDGQSTTILPERRAHSALHGASKFNGQLFGSTALVLALLVLLSRIVAFWVFDQWDVVNDSGVAIKPLGEPAYLDYSTYKMHIDSAWHEMLRPLLFFQHAFSDGAEAWAWLHGQSLKPGPIFPGLLNLWGYERIRAPLSLAYLLTGCGLGWLWAMFLAWRGMGYWVQALAACFPALVYYSFLVSTDLLYAVLMAVFYASAWSVLLRKQGAWMWCMVTMAVALLSRPNALAMVPVLFVVLAAESTLRWWTKSLWMLIWGFISAYMLIYYLPYFWVHESNSVGTNYWGIYPDQFHEGLLIGWPQWLNQSVSLLLLAISKLIYSVGLRPSYAEISSWLVVARASPGLLFLPGLFYGLWRGQWFDRVFVFFFLLPVYVGAAQERYLLAITPLLLLWGIQAYRAVWSQVVLRTWARLTA